MAKKTKRTLVRLANGVIEDSDSVGAATIALRRMSVENQPAFVLLCKWECGMIAKLPVAAREVAAKFRLLVPGDEAELYDDVRAVLASSAIWKKNSVSMGVTPLHTDQTNIDERDFHP